ncbi:hypothetical protein J520_2846 [Acinetobacter sp. 869535]|nr:hypothetical protein J538_3235 [Acinetobacter sp. 272263]EXC27345.1 hypothetical protein J520_2846 [Acinetobacter sp. 869535]EXE54126.1 hypothetical protein J579_3214 [Acinetobacter sp. 1239920]
MRASSFVIANWSITDLYSTHLRQAFVLSSTISQMLAIP